VHGQEQDKVYLYAVTFGLPVLHNSAPVLPQIIMLFIQSVTVS